MGPIDEDLNKMWHRYN